MRSTSSNSADALESPITDTPKSSHDTAPHSPPDEPMVIIQPGKAWSALHLRDVWQHRELLYFMIWRDVKVRYKQTTFGIAWTVMQPLFTMLIFTIFFGRLAGFGERTDGIPYPIFAYAALLPWTFFNNTVTNSGNSLVGNAHLITKVYFPRMIIPGATVGAGLVDLAIAFGIFFSLMIYYRVALTWNMLLLPVVLALATLLALGVGMWLSALNVKYRDIRHGLPFMMQLWMFASPIIYPVNVVPAKWQWLLALNPLTGIIEGFRAALLGRAINWHALGFSATITLVVLICAAYSFQRMEKRFADVV